MGILLTMLTTAKPQRGAGEGNRTLVISLEGFSSTIELHPQNHQPATPKNQNHPLQRSWWREKDSNLRRQSRQIYSLIPLTAWVSLHNSEPKILTPPERNVKLYFGPGDIVAEVVLQSIFSCTFADSRCGRGDQPDTMRVHILGAAHCHCLLKSLRTTQKLKTSRSRPPRRVRIGALLPYKQRQQSPYCRSPGLISACVVKRCRGHKPRWRSALLPC